MFDGVCQTKFVVFPFSEVLKGWISADFSFFFLLKYKLKNNNISHEKVIETYLDLLENIFFSLSVVSLMRADNPSGLEEVTAAEFYTVDTQVVLFGLFYIKVGQIPMDFISSRFFFSCFSWLLRLLWHSNLFFFELPIPSTPIQCQTSHIISIHKKTLVSSNIHHVQIIYISSKTLLWI